MTSTSDLKAPVPVRNGSSEDEFDLSRHLGILHEYRGTVAATVLLTLVGGALYMAAAPPLYRASAALQIEQKASNLGEFDQLLAHVAGETSTELEILNSRALLGGVIDELRLDVVAVPRHFPLLGRVIARAYQGPGVAEPPLWGLGSFAWGGESIRVERISVPPELEELRLKLVVGEGGAYTLLDPDSELLLSGHVGEPAATPPGSPQPVELLISELDARPGTRFWVMRRSRLAVVEELQRALHASEKGLNTGVLALSLDGQDPDRIAATLQAITQHYIRRNVDSRREEAEQTLVFLDSQLPGVRKELERAETALSEYRAGKGNVDLGLEAQSILQRSTDVERSLSALTLERSELRQRFTESHPVLIAANRKLARLRTEQAALNTQLKGLPSAELTSAQLMRDVKVANELYLQLNNKAQEYRVIKASTVGSAHILDEAVVAREPVGATKAGVLAISLVLGLALGIALSFTRHALHSGVKEPAMLEAGLQLPVYATLPLGKNGRRGTRLILAQARPRDLVTESLRALRTRLQLALKDSPNSVVALTAPSPGAGTSFVSVNLAWVLADAGKRVLLVDANLRGGVLHRYFGADRANGLSEILRGTLELQQAVRQVPGQSLSFLATGVLPPDPAELLQSDRFTQLVARMSAEYELVVIDTPPILAVTDAALVGRRAGVNLAVVRAGVHPMREIAAAIQRLQQNGVSVQGAVFNAVPRSQAGRAVSGIYQYEYPTVR